MSERYKQGIHTGYGKLNYSNRYLEYAQVIQSKYSELNVNDYHIALAIL